MTSLMDVEKTSSASDIPNWLYICILPTPHRPTHFIFHLQPIALISTPTSYSIWLDYVQIFFIYVPNTRKWVTNIFLHTWKTFSFIPNNPNVITSKKRRKSLRFIRTSSTKISMKPTIKEETIHTHTHIYIDV